MRRIPLFALAAILTLAACSGAEETLRDAASEVSEAVAPQETAIDFSSDILPVLQQDLAPLFADQPQLSFESHEALFASGDLVIPYSPKRSPLVRRAKAERPAGLTDDELSQIMAWIAAGAPSDAGTIPYADATNLLYVTSQNSALVYVIDMDADRVVRVVDFQELGYSENAKPHHVAVAPDGAHWYVSLIGEGTVLKMDRDNEIVDRYTGFETPGMLAYVPEDDLLVVGRSMSAPNPPSSVAFVSASEMDEIELADTFFPRPHALTLRPQGDYGYIASLTQNQIMTLDLESLSGDVTSLSGQPHTLVQFAITPDGQTMIGGGQVSGQLLFFDLADPANPQLVDSLRVNAAPWHPVITPDGQTAYFGNKMANTVTVLDVPSRRIQAVIEGDGIANPHGTAISPDGTKLYVSNSNLRGMYAPRYDYGDNDRDGTLVVIDTTSNEIIKVIELGENPTGIGVPTIARSGQ
jgi:DNA-binding beta-propeller fold protein YncE